MGGTVFTYEQNKAIETRNADILVSAAAGSGKTAVLVERIMGIITDSENPVDIDSLLIVTFTSAAAAEMKERIAAALEKSAENSDDEHILRQLALIGRADITTIHSFCMKVVRENYTKLDIDPDFRVADENECALIKNAVLDELFERMYAGEDNSDFLDLVEIFGRGMTDGGLKEAVLGIHSFIQSMPFPEKFLIDSAQMYDFDIDSPFEETVWGKYIKERCRLELNEYIKCTDRELRLALDGGPESYARAVSNDLEQLSFLLGELDNGLERFSECIASFKFVNIGRAGKNDDKSKAEVIKSLREIVKKGVSALKENFFFAGIQAEKRDVHKTGRIIKAVSQAVMDFNSGYSSAKREKNIADFNDLEHFALRILIDKDSGDGFCASPEAMQLQKKYYEVMTDEYQDSNPVQEMILSAVSGHGDNRGNRFMVGDIKQSIYRFRQAEPGLFLEKYNTYKESGNHVRIDLFKNFRSRDEILSGINFVFRQIMTKQAGEMDYTKDAWLYTGAEYPPKGGYPVEIDIIDKNSEDINDELDELTSAEAEMRFVAGRIKELFESGFKVYDTKSGQYRDLRYSDIAIIMRKVKNWGRTAVEALEDYGIPAYSDSSEKYFERREISDILSLLGVIDNSRQDIPLIASLKIPFYDVSDDELLQIRMSGGDLDFYSCVKLYAQNGNNLLIKEKLQRFLSDLRVWKNKAAYVSVGELIWDIYNVTGYYDYAGALKNGAVRQSNLMLLIEKADELEKNNFRGLFNFIRYIERLQKTGSDFSGSKPSDEGSDAVKIMTVHKSKGLEFPVVFLSGTGSLFNKSDSTSPILLHNSMGMAVSFTDLENRTERVTVSKKALADKIKSEGIAEEMRVLYVAMTRAKEKLIITGSVSNVSKKCAAWTVFTDEENTALPYYAVMHASSFLDWIAMSAARHKDGAVLRDLAGMDDYHCLSKLFLDSSAWDINIVPKLQPQEFAGGDKKDNDEYEAETKVSIDFDKMFEWKYQEEKFSANLYVSEVKRFIESIEQDPHDEIMFREADFARPKFLSGEETLTSAQKGTAVHAVLENIDFSTEYTPQSIAELILSLRERGLLSDKEAESINVKKIMVFLESRLCRRMRESGKVYKETPFAMEMTPFEIFGKEEYKKYNEAILVHGMIDCFFVENDSLVLVDYKTDYVRHGEEHKLKEKYYIQLGLYKRALEKSYGMPVSQTCIFSLSTGNEIVF